jgi:hypothetical protein
MLWCLNGDFQNLCFIFFLLENIESLTVDSDMARIVNNSYKWRKPSPHERDFEVEFGLNPHSSTVSNPILYLLSPPPPTNVQSCKLHTPVVQYQKWKGCVESFALDSYMTKQQRTLSLWAIFWGWLRSLFKFGWKNKNQLPCKLSWLLISTLDTAWPYFTTLWYVYEL